MQADSIRTDLQTSLGDAYTIERELGGGAMSHVFVVTDRALGRRLVVKIPPIAAAGSLSVERFEREIQVAARLQHPHIVPLIAVGITTGGARYYTMPFVPGESLRNRMQRGRLPVAEAIRVLRDVASALAYAHRQGVVHRDIKPENVLLHDDAAVVTDFGIAKAKELLRGVDVAGAGTLTAAGMSLGTPLYMAPEQATGDEIDQRVDIYAWGMMAYELLSGAHPFAEKATAQQIIAAQITEAPSPLTAPNLPPEVVALVMRSVAKNAGDRPKSAADVVKTLDAAARDQGETIKINASGLSRTSPRNARRRWTASALGAIVLTALIVAAARRVSGRGGAAASAKSTLAVLGFLNESRDSAFDYLAEGLSDELRSRLTGIPNLAIKGAASSAPFVGRVDPRDVGKKLGVTHVIVGTVRRTGNQVHVTAELDDAGTGDALWSETFDRDVHELASLRDSMAYQVMDALQVRTAAGDVADHETKDFEAYDALLQGQHAFSRLDFTHAAAHYRDATERDPSYARAWASLTIALASEPRNGHTPVDSALAAARVTLARATALDASSPLVRVADASVRVAAFDFRQAAAILADVVNRHPDDVLPMQLYVHVLGCLGRVSDALEIVERIRRIDPLNPFVYLAHEHTLTLLHRFDEAADEGRNDLEAHPGNVLAQRNLATAYAFLGKPDSAVRMMEAAWRGDSDAFASRGGLAFAYAAAGRWADVDRLERGGSQARRDNSPDFDAALFDIVNGRSGSAMTHVERGVAAKQPMFATAWIACTPEFDPLKRDPRFGALMSSIGAQACAPVEHFPIPTRPR